MDTTNKKIFISLLILTPLVVIGILYFPQIRSYFEVFTNSDVAQVVEVQNTMAGSVTKVGDGFIVVQGILGGETKEVEFQLTSSTKLRNNVIVFTKAQMDSGKPFHPETKFIDGKIQDLTVNARILQIKSQENLLKVDKATAVEINYITYVYP